jgi:hypothetical protein
MATAMTAPMPIAAPTTSPFDGPMLPLELEVSHPEGDVAPVQSIAARVANTAIPQRRCTGEFACWDRCVRSGNDEPCKAHSLCRQLQRLGWSKRKKHPLHFRAGNVALWMRLSRQYATLTGHTQANSQTCRNDSAGVVEDDLPAMRAFAPDQRKDAVVFLGFSLGGSFEVELAGDEGDFRFATA